MSQTPRYQLDPYILQLRGEKDERARHLAAAEEEASHQDAILTRLIDRTRHLVEETQRWQEEYQRLLRAAGLTAQALSSRRDHLRRLEGDLAEARRVEERQRQVQENLRRRAEEARAALVAKSAEVRVHEDRRDRWLADLRRAEAQREQKQAEETAAAQHERRRRESSSGPASPWSPTKDPD